MEVAVGIEAALADAILGELADDIQRALPRRRRHAPHPHVELAHDRHHRARDATDVRVVDRHVAPADHALALLAHDILERALARRALPRVARQEHLADREPPTGRELQAQALRLRAEEPLGQLQQDPGAVAGLGIGAARRAMRQPPQHLEPLIDDRARLLAADMRDEADAARVVLGARLVQAVARRQPGHSARH